MVNFKSKLLQVISNILQSMDHIQWVHIWWKIKEDIFNIGCGGVNKNLIF